MSELAWRAARDFARRLRDPDFRRYAVAGGYRPDRDMVLALGHEPLNSVLERAARHSGGCPVTVVVYRPGTDRGFSFVELPGDRGRLATARRPPWPHGGPASRAGS